MCWVYLVRCSDGTLYCGATTDLKKRIDTHNSGKGAKYTKNRLPVELVWSEEFDSYSEALRKEYRVKRLNKLQKESLIQK